MTQELTETSLNRIGIFGGSFDPIHLGHLILAEQCLENVGLDRIIFVPAAQSPLKENSPLATNRQRLEMLALAIAGHQNFSVSDLELERGGKSFTVDTLKAIKNLQPKTELFFLMGEDSADSFSRWKDPQTICELATPVVVRRPQVEHDEKPTIGSMFAPFIEQTAIQTINDLAFKSRLIEISSSDIRHRCGSGQSIRFLLPRSVEKFIDTNQVYSQR